MENNIKAIIFDIGGTIVNKQKNGYRDSAVISDMVQFLGLKCTAQELITEITNGEKKYGTWKKRTNNELSLEEKWSSYYLPEQPEQFIRQNANQLQNFWTSCKGKRWISPETIDTLKQLHARGYILATVSHTTPQYLKDAGIDHLFSAKIYATEYGKRKPHPAIFLAAAKQCGALPQECAYVGDRPSRDVIGSREAGIHQVILIKNSSTTQESEPCPMQPDHTIESINELLDLFPGNAACGKTSTSNFEEVLLYDAGLSSMWWSKDTDTAEDFCSKGRILGFTRFELNHQITPEEFSSIDFNHYRMGSLHDPCPAYIPTKQLERQDCVISSLEPSRRKEGVNVVKRTILQAYQLGANSIVIHPGHILTDRSMDDLLREYYQKGLKGTPEYEDLRERIIADRKQQSQPHMEALLKSLREIMQYAEDLGIVLGLENRLHYYEMPIFDEMQTILDMFPQPWIGWQLDIGHIQVNDELGLMSFDAWLNAFHKRIVGVHLHDVKGITDHLAPGSGEVDFEKIASYLPVEAFRTLEISKTVSVENLTKGMKILEQTGCITRL